MRHALTERRKDALLENADKLHSGASMSAPTLKSSKLGVVRLVIAMAGFGLFVLWAFNA